MAPSPDLTYLTIALSPTELEGLRHWHGVDASLDAVYEATGADLIPVLDRLAAAADAGQADPWPFQAMPREDQPDDPSIPAASTSATHRVQVDDLGRVGLHGLCPEANALTPDAPDAP